jgi:hypothetical protein
VQETEKTAEVPSQTFRQRVVFPVPEGPETTINMPRRGVEGIMPMRLPTPLLHATALAQPSAMPQSILRPLEDDFSGAGAGSGQRWQQVVAIADQLIRCGGGLAQHAGEGRNPWFWRRIS